MMTDERLAEIREFVETWGPYTVAEHQRKDLLAEVDRLRAELADYHNAKKFVDDQLSDEKHCGCVAVLRADLSSSDRRIAELERAARQTPATDTEVQS